MRKFLALFLLISTFLAFPSFQILALEDTGSQEYDITTSDVMEDLSRTYIDGKKFDPLEYPLNPSADYMLVLSVIEYAWAGYGLDDNNSSYGLYFYLYNPSGDKPLTRGAHQVQMSVSKSDFYVKYLLKLVSVSEDNRFLKFSVVNAYDVFDRLWSSTRIYKISGIDVETKAKGVKDYEIAGTYTFTGTQAAKTLECQTDTLTTISLKVGDTCYRTDTSDKGAFHKYELDTVYFSIPDQILKVSGDEIDRIKFQMTQKRITGVVTSNQDAYNGAFDFIANGIAPYCMSDYSKSISMYSATIGWFFQTNVLESFSNLMRAYSWNAVGYTDRQYLSFFGYAPGITEDAMEPISGDVLLEYWDKYPLLDQSLVDHIPLDNYTIDIKDSFTSLSYDSNHNFFERMLEYGLGTKKYDDQTVFSSVLPFQKITSSDLTGRSAADIASTYYVLENDVASLESYISSAESRGESVYLFRFNMQDYLSIPGFMGEEPPIVLSDPTSDSFYFEEYIYEDFDIIDIALRSESGIVTVLPVVMSPVTIVPDIEAPFIPPNIIDDLPDFRRIFGYVMIALVVILAVWLVSKLTPKRVRVVNGSGRRRRRR